MARSRGRTRSGGRASPVGCRSDVRLRDRGRRVSGMCDGRSPERGPRHHGPATRSGRPGLETGDPDPGSVLEVVQHRSGLGLSHDSAGGPRRTELVLAEREDARWKLLDECDDVGSRGRGGLRRGGRKAASPAGRGTRSRRTSNGPRTPSAVPPIRSGSAPGDLSPSAGNGIRTPPPNGSYGPVKTSVSRSTAESTPARMTASI